MEKILGRLFVPLEHSAMSSQSASKAQARFESMQPIRCFRRMEAFGLILLVPEREITFPTVVTACEIPIPDRMHFNLV
jgi:hypothetical protein